MFRFFSFVAKPHFQQDVTSVLLARRPLPVFMTGLSRPATGRKDTTEESCG